MQLNLLVLSYVASAAVAGVVAVLAWRRRQLVGAGGLTLLMLAAGWWLVANAFEAAALDRSTKIAWSVLAYPGIEVAPVLYLLFVLRWTRQDGRLTRGLIALLLLVPAVSVGMAATNDWHHLLWPSVTLIDAWGVTAVYEHGPWFWVEAVYAYFLLGVGLVALFVAIVRSPEVHAAKLRLVIVGTLVPAVAALLYASGLDAPLHADLSSIAFAATGVIAAWAVLRSRLLDVVPVAWPKLVDALADALVVLDPDLRIVAFNVSATRLLGVRRDTVGQSVDAAFRAFPELIAVCRGSGDRAAEIRVDPALTEPPPMLPSSAATTPEAPRWFNVRVTAIEDGRGRDAGRLLVLRDVTERRQLVETIRTMSVTDELTGLLNRRGFTTLAEQQLRTSLRTRHRLWLLFADLDGLKQINDRLGHEAGDRALCEVASLLRMGSFREADLVARLGGDEFAILATEISPTDPAAVVRRVEDAVRRANERPDREFVLSLSAGIATFDPGQPETLDELLAQADRRMYQAKQSRGGGRAAGRHEAAPEQRA